ncbi:MAG: cob(I)yrinic acid a,c-diamide adenosyltransferase [Treponema sp.]|nr:cob(I)yrinic acid a,c-diamide adenosyltransferase [Treponema sp.]
MQSGSRKKASIVTGNGDGGYTDIIGGRRLLKDHPVVECLGTIDELGAFLGDAKAALPAAMQGSPAGNSTGEIISSIQKGLFTLMAVLAGMPVPETGLGGDGLERMIGELESELPPFSSFAVPGANPVSAKLHIARTVCRRVERRMVSLDLQGEAKEAIAPYINRLSDLLFLLAQKEAAK